MQEKFFYKGIAIAVFDSVFFPREDSVLLADAVGPFPKAFATAKGFAFGKTVLDLGCGSGIQGLNALLLGAKKCVFADVDKKAVENAKANAKALGFAKKCAFKKSDLFSALKGKKFGLIIFNPPYVDSGKEKRWLDTDGGRKGRLVLDSFLMQAKSHLAKGGEIFFVQSSLNGESRTKKLLREKGFAFGIVAREPLFFEELIVFKAWLSG